MLIILPPSETKAPGGSTTHGPLSLSDAGSAPVRFAPELNPVRARLAEALAGTAADLRAELGVGAGAGAEGTGDAAATAADVAALTAEDPRLAALAALKLKPTQLDELEANAGLWEAPLLPAIERYTGVCYDALDVTGEATGTPLSPAERSRLAVGSSLFGVSGAEDLLPYYRLTAGAKLATERPGDCAQWTWATLKSFWGRQLSEALIAWQEATDPQANALFDFRSGGYRSLGAVPRHSVELRVESLYPDGSRKVVSHFNKHYKGVVARALARRPEDAGAAEAAEFLADTISTLARREDSAWEAEISSPHLVTLVVPTPA